MKPGSVWQYGVTHAGIRLYSGCFHLWKLQRRHSLSGLIEVGVVTTLEELVAEESWKGDFPGSPVVKTPLSQCRGTGFDPWEGNQSSAGKESACNACRRPRFDSWVGKIPWRRARLPTPPVFWPGEFHGLYSPWGSQRVRHDWATFTFTLQLGQLSDTVLANERPVGKFMLF